jgi:protein-disulfide isomerase
MHMAFLGEESQWAAEASECAADQNAFWPYHDKLFASQAGENQGAFNKDKLKAFAVELGLEAKAFNDCLDSGKYTQLVQSESAAAGQLGVRGTPSFFVNDWPTGAVSVAEFGKLFEKAKQGIHPPPTPTPLPEGVQFYDADPNRPGLTYDGSPTQGDAKAPVLLLAFEDLKSGDAAQYVKGIEPALVDKYIKSGRVRLLLKLYPMTAPKAAAAAFCALDQGKFWEFRDALYTHQTEWKDGDDAAMTGYAKGVGMDEAKFKACLADPQTQAQVDAALKFGQQVGVPSVPAFLFIDPKQNKMVGNIVGAATLADFESKLDAALNPPPTPAADATPTPVAIAPQKLASLQVGVDADGHFYRGDPNAPIKLTDFSDFQ